MKIGKTLNIKLTPADKFWLGLGLYALAADVFLWRHDEVTMSCRFGEWLKSRNGKLACATATVALISHLYIGMPLPLQTQAKKYLGGIK